MTFDLEFIKHPFADSGKEEFPDAAAADGLHRVLQPIPVIEFANHTDAFGIRSPDREPCSPYPFDFHQVGTEFVKQPKMGSFSEKMLVQLLKMHFKIIRVVPAILRTVLKTAMEQVRRPIGQTSAPPFKDACVIKPLHRLTSGMVFSRIPVNLDFNCRRFPNPNNPFFLLGFPRFLMKSEPRPWEMAISRQKRLNGLEVVFLLTGCADLVHSTLMKNIRKTDYLVGILFRKPLNQNTVF